MGIRDDSLGAKTANVKGVPEEMGLLLPKGDFHKKTVTSQEKYQKNNAQDGNA
jgi:hypothetical protein